MNSLTFKTVSAPSPALNALLTFSPLRLPPPGSLPECIPKCLSHLPNPQCHSNVYVEPPIPCLLPPCTVNALSWRVDPQVPIAVC